MNEIALSLKNIFNTKQPYDLKNSNTNTTYNKPTYRLQKQLTFIDILLAERLKKSQEMMLVCSEIQLSLFCNTDISESLISELQNQLNTFDKMDLPVVQYIKKNINYNDDKARNTLIDLGYIDRAVTMASTTFSEINNRRKRLSLNTSDYQRAS